MKKVLLKIGGMTCSACSSGLEKFLNRQEGIESASLSFMTGKLVVKCTENMSEDIIKKIKKMIKKEEPDVEIEEL